MHNVEFISPFRGNGSGEGILDGREECGELVCAVGEAGAWIAG